MRATAAPADEETAEPGRASPLAELRGVDVAFRYDRQWTTVVRSVDLTVEPGQTLGIVGESGSGKSVTSLLFSGLVPAIGGRATGEVRFRGRDVTALSEREWSSIRGREIGMIFQQPTRSLNPAFTIGGQIAETVRRHTGASRRDARSRAVEMLDRVGIPDPARRAGNYPHQFSGGQCQRVMIAMALACEPALLIADEPTTALDVTVQARVLDLLREIQHELGIGIVFISHDLGVVQQIAHRVAVMYAGEIVEHGRSADVLRRPAHPYTDGLLGAVPGTGTGTRLVAIPGTVPGFRAMPTGCRFHPRCAHAQTGRCDTAEPALLPMPDADHRTRCLRTGELALRGAAS